MVKLLVFERNHITRAGISALLSNDGYDVFEALTSADVIPLIERHEPDCSVLSEEIFDEPNRDTWFHLKQNWPSLRMILLVRGPDVLFRDADGLIMKDATAEQLLSCVNSVCAGYRWVDPVILNALIHAGRPADVRLTHREFQIAGFIARGLRNKEVAREMKVSEATVKMHLHHIYEKFHLTSRTELALRARELRQAANYRH